LRVKRAKKIFYQRVTLGAGKEFVVSSETVRQSRYAVAHLFNVEVQEIAEFETSKPEIAQELCPADRQDGVPMSFTRAVPASTAHPPRPLR